MSGAGKSILTAGILRLLSRKGYSCAPFKSQNMALNSYVTKDGLEIGRAQALQAAAAGILPSSDMNPILLKPLGDKSSQVIVNGKPIGNMTARDYFAYKKELIPDIKKAYERLSSERDIIVIEGAGSPVEINLRENDIVNMGLAEMLDAPVLLAGNIDPGGVFAQLLGTISLLREDERARVKGLIINKFRGDATLLKPGLSMFKEYCDIPFAGIVPYVKLDLEEEDSMSETLKNSSFTEEDDKKIRICAVRLPYISNYTDFEVLEEAEGVSFIYTDSVKEIEKADLIILPGTKNTIGDLKWLKEKGLFDKISELANAGRSLCGICGGFQMLGRSIKDPDDMEAGGTEEGLSLLDMDTVFAKEKVLKQAETRIDNISGDFSDLSGVDVKGYEIHMGVGDKVFLAEKNVFGTYIHGIFDSPEFTGRLLNILRKKTGKNIHTDPGCSRDEKREKELDKLADVLEESLDMNLITDAIFS